MKNRILFLGSRLQSYRCFHYLVNHYPEVEVVALAPHVHPVDTRDDQNVMAFAREHGITVIDRREIVDQTFDLGISLLYDSVLTEQEISIPAKGFINFHLGPLPRLKGSNSVLHAIRLAREEDCWQFAVALHYIVAKIDSGPIIDSLSMPIFEDDTAWSLHNRASEKVFELFVKNIGGIIAASGKVDAVPQSGESRFFRKDDVDHYIDLNLPELEVYDRIRALSFPGKPRPYTLINDKKIFLTLDEK